MAISIPSQQHLGQAIRKIREEGPLTIEALAIEAGVDVSYLNNAEKHGRNLTWGTFTSIVRVLEVPVSQVVVRAESIAEAEDRGIDSGGERKDA